MYVCGADLESASKLATADIKEVLAVSGQPSNVNIVIETGGASSWASTYSITASKLQRHHVSNRQLVTDSSLTYASMGSSSTLQSFLEYGLTNYPADKTGLIMWNHGGGISGVCFDEKKSNDALTTSEVASAVKGALKNTGKEGQKLEWIGYDACLMNVLDIAAVNSDYFNYMIASQETEAGEGWDYDKWLPTLYKNTDVDTPTLLNSICTTFKSSTSDSALTLSALDLSKMSEFTTEFETFAGKFTSSNWSKLKTAANNALEFSSGEGIGNLDAVDFLNKVHSQFSSVDVTSLISKINEMVVANVYGSSYRTTKPCGTCIFFAGDASYHSKDDYSTADTKFPTWRTLNVNNGSFYSGGSWW